MKKLIAFLILMFASPIIFVACEPGTPSAPELNITQNQLVLSKVVAVGASFTAGFQSGGMVEDFQLKSFPHIIAQQIGKSDQFELPLIAAPGIGSTPGFGPLKFENGQIVAGDPVTDPAALLKNAQLPRPYDNLGVPGADLNDMLNTVDGSGGNPFFDLILRNPNFANTAQIEQAILLQPSLILLLLGGNDVLGAALSGTAIEGVTITPQADFDSRMSQILDKLQSETRAQLVMANLPDVTALPYVNVVDNFIYKAVPALGIFDPVPVVFDANFQPVLFDPAIGLFLPLLTDETNVAHLLLPALSQYRTTGLGVPDSAAIVGMGLPPAQAQLLVLGMQAAGLIPSGNPFPGSLTLTEDEETIIRDATAGFNATILSLAQSKGVAIADLIMSFNEIVTNPGTDGVTARFVLLDPTTTMFSLDGFHPSNAGQAVLAKAYIKAINGAFGLSIPEPNPADFTGQFAGTSTNKIAAGVIEKATKLFIK